MIYSIPLAEAIDEYTSSSLFSRLAASTRRHRRYTLSRLLAVAANINSTDLSVRHVDLCLQDLEQGDAHLGGRRKGKSQRSLNSDRASLGMFIEWMRSSRSYVSPSFNPVAELKYSKKTTARKMLQIPAVRLPEVFAAAGARHPVERMACALGSYLGCRPAEAAMLRIESVDFARLEVELLVEKTHQRLTMPMCVELRDELVDYFQWYKRAMGVTKLSPGWYLLPARLTLGSPQMPRGLRGVPGATKMTPGWPVDPAAPLGRAGIGKAVKAAARAVGYSGSELDWVGGHTLRRSAARALYERLRDHGRDDALVMVQTLLGHAQISTTMAYIGVDTQKDRLRGLLAGQRMYDAPVAAKGADVVDLDTWRRAA
ncbi:tyrosine-type recombinase/integrase [Longispora fulva]|uniref:Integrase n=2 Tax=Longispora fulva TaxID=619741 RepID=A0A8J7KMM1_9ACTN|nr:tyrosine-type recombinase/integrase [Longispora fulva]MBG6140659.1 integrase [Longispora fulva]